MRKISKKKLYGAIVNAGIISSTAGVGTFMANYFAYDKMYPAVTIASVGVTTVGILSAFYGLQKQFNTPEDEGNEERERDLIHEALYNPELLKRQRKELKIVESRFVREEQPANIPAKDSTCFVLKPVRIIFVNEEQPSKILLTYVKLPVSKVLTSRLVREEHPKNMLPMY